MCAPTQRFVHTNAVHIIPEGLSSRVTLADFPADDEEQEIAKNLLVVENSESGEGKAHQSNSMHSDLRLFGNSEIREELNGNNIHRLENILTMCTDDHAYFDDLKMWFEPTGTPNEYFLRVSQEEYRPSIFTPPEIHRIEKVTLEDTSDRPAPSSRYLALHAACCRVAHMSGAGQYLDEIYRDFDDVAVQARYVSSSAVCDVLIKLLEVMPCGKCGD